MQNTHQRLSRSGSVSSYDAWSQDWEDLKSRFSAIESDDNPQASNSQSSAKGIYQITDDTVTTMKNRLRQQANRLDIDLSEVNALPDDPRRWPKAASDLLLAANIFEYGGNPTKANSQGSDAYLRSLGGPNSLSAKRDIYKNIHHTNVDAATVERMGMPQHFGAATEEESGGFFKDLLDSFTKEPAVEEAPIEEAPIEEAPIEEAPVAVIPEPIAEEAPTPVIPGAVEPEITTVEEAPIGQQASPVKAAAVETGEPVTALPPQPPSRSTEAGAARARQRIAAERERLSQQPSVFQQAPTQQAPTRKARRSPIQRQQLVDDPVQQLYGRAGSDPVTALYGRTGFTVGQRSQPIPFEAVTPSNLREVAKRGFEAGVETINTDAEYFKGILNTITGDDTAAAINIETAKGREERIAESLSGLESFPEFMENPTFDGFLTQSFKLGAQVAPFALTTIQTGGTAAVIGVVGKTAITAGGRLITKRLVKESIARTAKNEATPSERELAEMAYRLAHRTSLGKTASRSALVGQFGEEFTLLAGSNFGENIDIEGMSQQEAAYRALAIAAPGAAIGVAGERYIQGAIFNSLGKVAKERGSEGSMIAGLAKEIAKATGKGSVSESITEVTQEGLQVANVMQADPTYSSQDAMMRLAESAFAAAIGGGAITGAGRAATGTLELAGGVFSKAGEFIESARSQQLDGQYNQEQYGLSGDGYTAPEPAEHAAAQVRSMLDENTERDSVWVAGSEPAYNSNSQTVTEFEKEGQTLYSRFVQGRGTIVSKNRDVVEAVANAEASDSALATALKYSNTKPVDADIVIEARDGSGNVVWAEATNEAGADAAYTAAEKQMPVGGKITRQSLEKALEERNTLVEEERNTVKKMDWEEQAGGEFALPGEEPVNIGGTESYQAGDGQVRPETEDNRSRFAKLFDSVEMLDKDEWTAVDFSSPLFANMSDSLLKTAARLKASDPDADIYITHDPEKGYQIMKKPRRGEQSYGKDSRYVDADGDAASPVSLTEFVLGALKKAATSEWARKFQTKTGWKQKTESQKVTVDGKAVNLIDLVKSGQRMVSIENKKQFTDGGSVFAQRQGFLRIMGQLLADGRTVKLGGQDISLAILNEVELLGKLAEGEQAATLGALLEAGIDGEMPASSRIDQILEAMSKADQNKLSLNEEGSSTENALFRLAKERKAYNKAYGLFKNNKGPEPKQTPLLLLLDMPAGFNGGKIVTLGKILLSKSNDAMPRDRQYEVVDTATDTVVSKGDRAAVQEFMENSDNEDYQVYAVQRKRADGTVLPRQEVDFDVEKGKGFVDEEPEQGDQDVLGFVQDPDQVIPEQENVFSYAQPGSGVPKKKVFGLENNTLASKILDIARRTLRLTNPISIFNVDMILSKDPTTQAEYAALFGDPKVAAYLKEVAQQLKDNPEGGGRYIGFKDAHIILVSPATAVNQLETAIVVGHELGHALFKEQLSDSLSNPVLYNRLFSDFEKARDQKDAPEAYQGNRGFEEWYADQTSYWAQKLYVKEKRGSVTQVNDPKKTRGKYLGRSFAVTEVKGLVKAEFQKLARKLSAFHKQLSKELQTRFSKEAYSTEFDVYIDDVVARTRDENGYNSPRLLSKPAQKTGAQAATFEQKVIVRKMAEAREKDAPGLANEIKKQVTKIIKSDSFTPIYNFMFTADSRMRKIGTDKIADLFYGRAQDSTSIAKDKLGFLKAAALEGNAWHSKLEDMIDGELSSEGVQASIDEAFSDAATKDLKGNALAVRQWLDRFYDEYIEPSNTDINRQKDYAPVVLKLSEIETRPEDFIQLILAENPSVREKDIRVAIQKLISYQQVVMSGKPISIKETNPAQSAEKAIKLTLGIGREKLAAANFLEDSDVALLRYVNNTVKRVEWNKRTKDSKGNSIYEEELQKLDKKAQKEIQTIVHKYLGYTESPLSPTWRAINSWGSLLQIIAILPLATLGSLPELAGPVIASKEFSSVMVAMKEIVNTIKNRDEARSLARDLGVVTSQSVANVMMSQSELEWMDSRARKITDGFFRVILLDTYTKFTREFASNMGVRFLMKHSDPEESGAFSARYLKELGVTADEVKVWSDSDQDFNTPEGRKVREALQRFVESSTLRPNAAERPLWASDPRWALAWQLKGFFYSYGKVMLAGAKREATARLDGVSGKDVNTYAALTGAAGVFALMGIATMPLAMVGMELREYAKYGLAWSIPGIDHEAKNYFRTDELSWGGYLMAAFERSFAAGPVTIASQAMQAADWGHGVTGAAAVVAGPTAETVVRMVREGFGSTVEHRLLPTGLL